MSFLRLIYWSALVGGWAAFIGWLLSEAILHYWIENAFVAILMATLVAVPIGGGVCFVYGLTNPNLVQLAKRLILGFAGGLFGGLLGALVGSCIFLPFRYEFLRPLQFLGFTLGWAFIGVGIGAGIGASEGIIDRSLKKLRNGVIGGVIGGFLGGLTFFPVSLIISSLSSRALSFVLLGLFVGLFIGLAQVLLKESWLTVEAGFRAGRQLILGKDPITMGTSEKSSLIFIAYGAKGVEPIHLKITKLDDGGYLLEDNQSRTGTFLNGQPVKGPTRLINGDVIQFGVNVVRFNERVKHGDGTRLPPPNVTQPAPQPAAPPSAAVKAGTPPASAVQAAKPAAAPAPPPLPPKPAPAPIPAPAPVPVQTAPPPKPAPPPEPPKPVEGPCPICGKKITGIPGARRCGACFTTF